eukprot:s12314_g3.t1
MKDKLLVPPEPVKAPVTGKPRREFKWGKLDESWREAFIKPLKDAIDVYTDNQAVEAVPMGMMVPPDSILPSRLVLTNKSEAKEIAKAKLKARWVLAGHLDKEAGKYATEAPASEILVLLLSDKNIWTRSILAPAPDDEAAEPEDRDHAWSWSTDASYMSYWSGGWQSYEYGSSYGNWDSWRYQPHGGAWSACDWHRESDMAREEEMPELLPDYVQGWPGTLGNS